LVWCATWRSARSHHEQLQVARDNFPWPIVKFSIKYLGLPLALGKLPLFALQLLVDRVADALAPNAQERLPGPGEDHAVDDANLHGHQYLATPDAEGASEDFQGIPLVWHGCCAGGKCAVAWCRVTRL
jgi:hypothetical protein